MVSLSHAYSKTNMSVSSVDEGILAYKWNLVWVREQICMKFQIKDKKLIKFLKCHAWHEFQPSCLVAYYHEMCQ